MEEHRRMTEIAYETIKGWKGKQVEYTYDEPSDTWQTGEVIHVGLTDTKWITISLTGTLDGHPWENSIPIEPQCIIEISNTAIRVKDRPDGPVGLVVKLVEQKT